MSHEELTGSTDRAAAVPTSLREIARDRSTGLTRFGYSARDGEFLCAATLLGGFFVRRQFRDWTGHARGAAEMEFLERATELRHVRACVGKRLYRVCCEWMYQEFGADRALGSISRAFIKRRLLALDYLTLHRNQSGWLVDSVAKSGYFQSLGIAADRLPAGVRLQRGKPRYFPGVIPIRIARGRSPMVEFLHPHATTSAYHLNQHLRHYEPLARGLRAIGIGSRWRVLAEDHVQLLGLRNAWGKWVTSHKRDPTEPEYFTLRRLVENEQWEELSVEDLNRYAELRLIHEYQGPLHPYRYGDRRYRAWLERGAPPTEPGADFAEGCELRDVLLKHDYSLTDRIKWSV